MKHIPIVYGDPEKWAPLLKSFLKGFRKHNPNKEILVLTDKKSGWTKEHMDGAEFVSLSVHDPVVNQLNLSGILKAYAAIHFAPCMVYDVDIDVRGPIEEGPWMPYSLAIGKDPLTRVWKLPGGRKFTEKNIGVMYLGSPEPGEAFLSLWSDRSTLPEAKSCPFFEQVVWSEVFNEFKHDACELPPHLNWSRMWPDDDPRIVLYHEHGKGKWN